MTRIYNRRDETPKRQVLRNDAPEAETRLWECLRGRQRQHCKFRRQHGVGPYILDFYCPALKLAIEIDGPTHDESDTPEYDAARQAYVETLGIRFLRFSNADVYHRLADVLTVIETWIAEHGPQAKGDGEEDGKHPTP